MKTMKLNVEVALYFLALTAAGFFRLEQLGLSPLVDSEAKLALMALTLSRSEPALANGLSGYSLWTSILFYLIEPSNFLARFWPAFFGILLVLTPWLFKKWLGRTPAILLSWGLAVSPGLVAISRQAGSAGIAIPALVLAVGLLLNGFAAPAGIMAGIALMSGPSVWMGILMGCVMLLWGRLVSRRSPGIEGAGQKTQDTLPWKRMVNWLVVTILLAGTLVFRQPAGLGALGTNFIEFIQGWGRLGETPLAQVLAAWLGYEMLPIFFGLLGFLRGLWQKRRLELLLGKMVLVSVLLVLMYPGRQPGDLAWMILPLWGLAAIGLYGLFRSFNEAWLPVLGHFVLVVILMVFSTFTIFGLVNNMPLGDAENQIRWISMIGSLGMIVAVTILIAWGWSINTAKYGLISAILCYLVVFNLSATWSVSTMGRNPSAEAWLSSGYFKDADLLIQTIEGTSNRSRGDRNTLEAVMVDFDSPALLWLLRERSSVSRAVSLPVQSQPSMVFTRKDDLGQVAERYTGQDFLLVVEPGWNQLTLREWVRWLIYRDSLEVSIPVILWIRTDLLPGNTHFIHGKIQV